MIRFLPDLKEMFRTTSSKWVGRGSGTARTEIEPVEPGRARCEYGQYLFRARAQREELLVRRQRTVGGALERAIRVAAFVQV